MSKGKVRRPRRQETVSIMVLSDPYATVAQATLVDMNVGVVEGGLFVATGSAKKEPGDMYDPVIDFDLAAGRALVNLGNQMVRSGNRRVRESVLEQAKRRVELALRGKRRAPRHARPAKGEWQTLPIDEIRERWGDESARRAETQRHRARQMRA